MLSCSKYIISSLLIVIALLASATDLLAAVTRIEITEKYPYANGREFEGIGAYERLLGRVYFSVDPELEVNQQVTDLDKAPRNKAGKVEFSADLEIVAPVDRSKANGTLFYDVNNRGNRLALRVFNEEADEFLMRKGIVLVWSGWIAEVMPDIEDSYLDKTTLMRMDAPIATDNGKTITGLTRLEMVTDEPTERINVTTRDQLGSYVPTESGLKKATLTVREKEADQRQPVPRDQWSIEVTPISAPDYKHSPAKVELVMPSKLQPGLIYELIYEAKDPVVQGLGLASIRDLISFLKYDNTAENPLVVKGKSIIKQAIGFGVSQSGRCLRVMLNQGFNGDEEGRIVFDGMIPHVAGAGLGFFNYRFCSPSQFGGQHTCHLYPTDMFPFAYEKDFDPYCGKTDGLLEKARAADVVPKIMHIHNSAEYWHRSGSLVHTDPMSKKDVQIPENVRIYAIGGAQHGWGNDLTAREPVHGTQTHNPTDYRPHLRAMLMAMIEWIENGTEPPDSVYPKLSDSNLVPWEEKASGWHPLPGVKYPEVIQRPELLDNGPLFETERILTVHPPKVLKTYSVLVPAVDGQNNEEGMLELPFVAVPIATFTGWNLRDEAIGAPGELLTLKGSYIPFARTKAERMANNDPRLSLEELYGSKEKYLEQVAAAMEKLVQQRHLLAEDVPSLMDRAKILAQAFDPPAKDAAPK